MNMIEKVARSMCAADGADWDAETCNQTANGEEPHEQREYWADKARAAIEAMKTATPEMYRAGIEANVGPRSTAHGYIYEAMISAALKE